MQNKTKLQIENAFFFTNKKINSENVQFDP